jgi:hypothetical protein
VVAGAKIMTFFAFLTFAVAAMSPTVAVPDDPPERISYRESGPEGGGLVHWYLVTGGHGQFQSMGSAPENNVSFDFKVGADGFQKIYALLAPLEGTREIHCVQSATDQAAGTLSFVRGPRDVEIYLDHGCVAAPEETAFRLLDQANRVILDWVGTDKWGDLIVAPRPIAPPLTANQPNCCTTGRKD